MLLLRLNAWVCNCEFKNEEKCSPPQFCLSWETFFWKVTSCKTAAITKSRKWFLYVKWLCKIFAPSAESSKRQFSPIPNGPFQLDGKRFARVAPCIMSDGENTPPNAPQMRYYLLAASWEACPSLPRPSALDQHTGRGLRWAEEGLCQRETHMLHLNGGPRNSHLLWPLEQGG